MTHAIPIGSKLGIQLELAPGDTCFHQNKKPKKKGGKSKHYANPGELVLDMRRVGLNRLLVTMMNEFTLRHSDTRSRNGRRVITLTEDDYAEKTDPGLLGKLLLPWSFETWHIRVWRNPDEKGFATMVVARMNPRATAEHELCLRDGQLII